MLKSSLIFRNHRVIETLKRSLEENNHLYKKAEEIIRDQLRKTFHGFLGIVIPMRFCLRRNSIFRNSS